MKWAGGHLCSIPLLCTAPEMMHLCKQEKTGKRKTGKDNGPYRKQTKERVWCKQKSEFDVVKIEVWYRERRGLLNLKLTYTYSLLIHCLQIPHRNQIAFFVFGYKKTAVNCPVYNSLGLCLFRCFWIELSMYYCSKFTDRGQGFAKKWKENQRG